MFHVEMYLQVRRTCLVEGMRVPEATRTFGVQRYTVMKMLIKGTFRATRARGRRAGLSWSPTPAQLKLYWKRTSGFPGSSATPSSAFTSGCWTNTATVVSTS